MEDTGRMGLLVSYDTLADSFYRHRNSVVSCLFSLNDLIGTVFHFLINFILGFLVKIMSAHLTERIEPHTGNVCI